MQAGLCSVMKWKPASPCILSELGSLSEWGNRRGNMSFAVPAPVFSHQSRCKSEPGT